MEGGRLIGGRLIEVWLYLKIRDNFSTFLKIDLAWVGSYVILKGLIPSWTLIVRGSRPVSGENSTSHYLKQIELPHTQCVLLEICESDWFSRWCLVAHRTKSHPRCSSKGTFCRCFSRSPSFDFNLWWMESKSKGHGEQLSNGQQLLNRTCSSDFYELEIMDVNGIFYKRRLRQFRIKFVGERGENRSLF